MIELLGLCGFGAQEMKLQLPRFKKVFNRLGITAVDIERGKQRLIKYYDTELQGVRKLLRLFVREMVNAVLAREEGKKKLIYAYMAPCFSMFAPALLSKSKEVFAIHHAWAFQTVLGCIFDKMVPVLEAAERKWLKEGGVAHCSNVKSVAGLFILDMIPKPDLLITSGYLCETAPKTLELMHELYDIPVWSYETCQDRELKDYSTATERIVMLAVKDLRSLIGRLEQVVGFEITDDMLRDSLDGRSKLKESLGKLRNVIENSDPMPISATHDALYMALILMTLSLDELPDAVDAVDTLREELQERVSKGQGAVKKGAPRVLAILPPNHTDPRLEHLVGELGIAIVGLDPAFVVPYEGKSEDPYVAMALYVQESMFTPTPRRIPLILEGCRRLNVAGVIDRFHVGCRTVAGDALVIRDAVKKELGIPVLLLEWDNFDSRTFNYEQCKGRLEVFKTMLVNRPS